MTHLAQSFADQYSWLPGVAVGVLGIFVGASVSITIYRHNRERKVIGFTVVSSVPVISRRTPLTGDLKVLFDGKELIDPHIVTIRIKNIGNRAILSGDYVTPITIKNRVHDGKLVSVSHMDEKARLIGGELNHDEIGAGKAEIFPELINPGEYFDVQLVFDGPAIPVLEARFTGQTAPIIAYENEFQRRGFYVRLASATMLLVLLGFFAIERVIRFGFSNWDGPLLPEALAFGFAIIGWFWILFERPRRRLLAKRGYSRAEYNHAV